MRPGEHKIIAVKDFKVPKSVHQVRQFIGLTSYFRQFVNNYAIISQPLTKLTKKTESWNWEPKKQEAFDTLKDRLMIHPTLSLHILKYIPMQESSGLLGSCYNCKPIKNYIQWRTIAGRQISTNKIITLMNLRL